MNGFPETFKSGNGNEEFTIADLVQEIKRYISEAPDREYLIAVGTDSHTLSGKRADFVTAIVVQRMGNGARYFYRHGIFGNFHTMRDRIIREALISLEFSTEFLELLRKELGGVNWAFEVHADVGSYGKTKEILSEVVAIIRGGNFEAKVKPESFAASSAADKHT